jgi:IS1 family transposase
VRNGKKRNGVQNYLCGDCGRQFIADSDRVYQGTLWIVGELIKRMLVRGCGIRDISFILGVTVRKVLDTLRKEDYRLHPRRPYYGSLEIDEFWTYVGKKTNKVWLIYAYHRASGEVVAYVWGKRDTETAKRLVEELKASGVKYGQLRTDKWDSFAEAFSGEPHLRGKRYTKAIEGNNCWLRHRVRRAFRRTCCFSKSLDYHLKAFPIAFYFNNFGFL